MNQMDDFAAHLTTGAVVVYAIEWLKPWPAFGWITAESKRVNLAISVIAAAVIAFGIEAQGNATTGWTIQIPPAQILVGGLWEWVKQIVLQQILYDGIVQKSGRS